MPGHSEMFSRGRLKIRNDDMHSFVISYGFIENQLPLTPAFGWIGTEWCRFSMH